MRQQKKAIGRFIFPLFLLMVLAYGASLFSQEMKPDTIGIGKKEFEPGEDIRIDYRCSEAAAGKVLLRNDGLGLARQC